MSHACRDPFLESPENISGPEKLTMAFLYSLEQWMPRSSSFKYTVLFFLCLLAVLRRL